MSWPHQADIECRYETHARAVAVAAALEQEVGDIDDDRSRTTIEREGARLTLAVTARDLVALRAAMNTWLGLLRVAEDTAALADEHG